MEWVPGKVIYDLNLEGFRLSEYPPGDVLGALLVLRFQGRATWRKIFHFVGDFCLFV